MLQRFVTVFFVSIFLFVGVVCQDLSNKPLAGAYDYLLRAIQKSEAGDYKGAIVDLDIADKASPNDSAILATRAFQYMFLNQLDKAKADVEHSFKSEQPEPLAVLAGGYYSLLVGDNENAVKFFDNIESTNTENWRLFLWRGRAHAHLEHFEKAESDLTNAVELKAPAKDVLLERGWVYWSLKQNAKAEVDVEKYLALPSPDIDGYVLRGDLKYMDGNYDAAVVDFTKALKGGSKLLWAHGELVQALFYSNRAEEALIESDKYIASGWDTTQGLRFRSLIRSAQKDWKGAIADIDAARAADKSFFDAQISRSYVYLDNNKPDLAASEVLGFLELNGLKGDRAVWAVINGYIALRKSNKPAEAQKFIDEWYPQLDKDDWNRSLAAHVRGEVPAGTLLKMCGDETGKLTEAHYYIGALQLLSGEIEKAKLHFNWIKENGLTEYSEYRSALAELARLATSPAPKYAQLTGPKARLTSVATKPVAAGKPTPVPRPAVAPKYDIPAITDENAEEIMYSAKEECGDGGDIKKGLAIADKLVAYGPDQWPLRQTRAMCREVARDYLGAIVDYTFLIKQEPDNHNWFEGRAAMYRKTGKPVLAAADEKKAAALSKNAGGGVTDDGDYPDEPSATPRQETTTGNAKVTDGSKPNDPDVGSGPYRTGTEYNSVIEKITEKCGNHEFRSGIAMANRLIQFAMPDNGINSKYKSWFPYRGRAICKEMMGDDLGALEEYNIAMGMKPDIAALNSDPDNKYDFAALHAVRGALLVKLGRRVEAKSDETKCGELGGEDVCAAVFEGEDQ